MSKTSFSKHPLLAGTFFLTLAGLISRIIGFFYRIFLSHTIGAEGLGIYQLIFPIYALTFSLTVSGIQTAISKYVAEAVARRGSSSQPLSARYGKNAPSSQLYLYTGLILSLLLSGACMAGLYFYAEPLAVYVLEEPRCTPLLQILSLTVPFGAIHSCINGYYYGLQKTLVPAVSQLFEQIARVGGVYLMYLMAAEKGKPVTMEMAVWGLVFGEIASVLYSVSVTRLPRSRHNFKGSRLSTGFLALKQISVMALPLTANRVFVNLFQSAETILIPGKLREFGYTTPEALSVYGVLTGMAMPLILFPSVITGSVAVMLLPAISEAQARNDTQYIHSAIRKSCFYCITLGLCCTLGFLIFGRFLGQLIYGNVLAGTFIVILGWICPFLYLTTTLSSILNGLGRTTATLLLNLTGSGIRILFILVLIPILGIRSYLWGILVSHLVVSGASLLVLIVSVGKSRSSDNF